MENPKFITNIKSKNDNKLEENNLIFENDEKIATRKYVAEINVEKHKEFDKSKIYSKNKITENEDKLQSFEFFKKDEKSSICVKSLNSGENEITKNNENVLHEKIAHKQNGGGCNEYKTKIEKKRNEQREKMEKHESGKNHIDKNNNYSTEDKLFYMNEHFLSEDYR